MPKPERERGRHHYVKLIRNLTVTGNCSVTIPLTIEPVTLDCRFTDDVNDPPAQPSCVPYTPDFLSCEVIHLDNPIVFGPDGKFVSYWGVLIQWQINGPIQTRSVQWTVEGFGIT